MYLAGVKVGSNAILVAELTTSDHFVGKSARPFSMGMPMILVIFTARLECSRRLFACRSASLSSGDRSIISFIISFTTSSYGRYISCAASAIDNRPFYGHAWYKLRLGAVHRVR